MKETEATEPAWMTSKGKLAMERFEEFALFRQNLTILQSTKNATNQELSKMMGIRPKRVEDFKQGRCHPNWDEIRAIVKFFSVTLDQIMYKRIIITFED